MCYATVSNNSVVFSLFTYASMFCNVHFLSNRSILYHICDAFCKVYVYFTLRSYINSNVCFKSQCIVSKQKFLKYCIFGSATLTSSVTLITQVKRTVNFERLSSRIVRQLFANLNTMGCNQRATFTLYVNNCFIHVH